MSILYLLKKIFQNSYPFLHVQKKAFLIKSKHLVKNHS